MGACIVQALSILVLTQVICCLIAWKLEKKVSKIFFSSGVSCLSLHSSSKKGEIWLFSLFRFSSPNFSTKVETSLKFLSQERSKELSSVLKSGLSQMCFTRSGLSLKNCLSTEKLLGIWSRSRIPRDWLSSLSESRKSRDSWEVSLAEKRESLDARSFA